MGLPGSGKTTYAKSILTEDMFLIDDPNRDLNQFNEAIESGKPTVLICDPLIVRAGYDRTSEHLKRKFGDAIDIEWICFENDPESAWANHLIRNQTDFRRINERFFNELSKVYKYPDTYTLIPVYKPEN